MLVQKDSKKQIKSTRQWLDIPVIYICNILNLFVSIMISTLFLKQRISKNNCALNQCDTNMWLKFVYKLTTTKNRELPRTALDKVYFTDTESFLNGSTTLTVLILFKAPPRMESFLTARSVSASGPPVNSAGVLSTVTKRPDATWKNKTHCSVFWQNETRVLFYNNSLERRHSEILFF